MTTRTERPATERQLSFIYSLASDRLVPQLGSCGEERLENLSARFEDRPPTLAEASDMISWLKAQPVDSREATGSTGASIPAEPLTPGVYEVAGDVYVVKPNRERSRLYAKRMVEIRGDRLTEADTVVQVEFEYAPGALRSIRPEHRMPLERARELTIRYGRCINCGRPLKAAESVSRGIGPVCIRAFAT